MKTKRIITALLGASVLALSACGGGGGSDPLTSGTLTPPPSGGGGGTQKPPTVEKTASTLETESDVADFLAMAGFGSTLSEQTALAETDAADWLSNQFKAQPTLYLNKLLNESTTRELENYDHRADFWDAMVTARDPVRQRMVFALSQIMVVSDMELGDQPLTMAHYMDILSENAFGNYRDLLQELTYSPAMARYLTYLRNRKGDVEKGRMPDENYAREIMQLFTIGLVELNMDGSPKFGTDGQPIETYSNEDIVGLARVFTGLSYEGGGFWDETVDARYRPLQAYPDKHSALEKSFLNHTISAGTGPEESINQALDHIFDHPNVAPFVSRQLIQRFTTSHPTPDYIERVANVFETGTFTAPNDEVFGTGERGDLEATLAAILLDESVLPGAAKSDNQAKVREPILRWVHWARAFNVKQVDASNEWALLYSDDTKRLGQRPFGASSVFNFYRPGFVAPGTETGANGLTAPEFQIAHEGASTGYANFMADFALDRSPTVDSERNTFIPNYTRELELVEDAPALIDHLDKLLLAGRMNDQTRERIDLILQDMPVRPDHADKDKQARIGLAVFMTVTDPAFIVQQ